jgi:uncharacterized protein (DUF2249 family)
MMSDGVVTLDVREDLRQGREPCGAILRLVDELLEGQQLRLLVPFEPVPLYSLLRGRGFGHRSRLLEGGDWEVVFSRDPDVAPPPNAPANRASPCGCAAVVEFDARGLEPPQPMVRILEALSVLPAGVTLQARTDRQPVHLYAHLEQRGFSGQSEVQPDGSFVTHIRRP